jgi:hypothetical protein
MGISIRAILILLLYSITLSCFCQSKFSISDPRLQLIDNLLYIHYDIINSDQSDRFIVKLEIKDAEGRNMSARTLTGDVGNQVSGGIDKRIIWDLESDSITMNNDIFVSIYAEHIPSIVDQGEAIEQLKGYKEGSLNDAYRDYNRAGIIIQSLIFPGLGLSRITENPHWLRGVAGYGCIAGSIVLNRVAINIYEDFKLSTQPSDAEYLLSKSTREDKISEILAYSAVGVWITDIIWNLLATSPGKNALHSVTMPGISITAGIDPISSSPLVGLCFTF